MKLVVEIDGTSHSADGEIASDRRRASFLEEQGFRIMRFTNEAVYENAEGVLGTVFAVLQKRL
jgi:very-short-patch-repair endonuclease